MSWGQTDTTSLSSLSTNGFSNPALKTISPYTPPVNHQTVSARVYASSAATGGSARIGIYDVTGGSVGATLVTSQTFSVPVMAAGWLSFTIPTITLLPTKSYHVGLVGIAGGDSRLYRKTTALSSLTGATGLPSPWVSSTTSSDDWLFEVITAPVVSIDTITDPITVGGTLSFTGTGWSGGTFTSITSNVSGATVSGISGSTTSGSATLSGWSDGQLYAEIPSAVTFTFNDGVVSSTKASNIGIPAGYTKLPLVSPLFIANTLANQILLQTGRTVATGDVFYHTTYSDLDIDPDTYWEATDAGSFDLWLYVSSGADAGKNYYYAVTITESGDVVISNGLTTAGLTSSGLTRVGLTSSGL